MKLSHLAVATLAVALGTAPVLAADATSSTTAKTGTMATVGTTGTLGVDLSKAGTGIQAQQAFYSGLSASQQTDIKSRCNAAGVGAMSGNSGSTTANKNNSGASAALSVDEMAFCQAVIK